MSKKPDFTKKFQKMVNKHNSPQSLADFLGEPAMQARDSQITPDSNSEPSKQEYKREEFKLPAEIAEQLRTAAFKLKLTKKEIVQNALTEYFHKIDL